MDNFRIFTTMRYDPTLMTAPDLGFTNVGWNQNPSPFYMLNLHRDRMLRAATYWGWTAAIKAISGDEGLQKLERFLRGIIREIGHGPHRLMITLASDGTLDHQTSPVPETHLNNLLPEKLPSPDTRSSPQVGTYKIPTGSPVYDVYLDNQETTPSEFTHHKTTFRDMYNEARKRAQIKLGEDKEVLLVNNEGHVMEGSIATPYFWRDGRWVTPPIAKDFNGTQSSGGNDGVTRRWALERYFRLSQQNAPSSTFKVTMDAIYSAQNTIKEDLGLSKIKVIHNQNYKRHGLKSYVSILNRYGFQPTKPGPYFHIDRVKQHGILPEGLKGALGGTIHKERVLVKKAAPGDGDGDGDGDQTTEITAEDQQNDSMYICEISIGEPAQKLLVDFDTGSADTWGKSAHSDHNAYDPKKSKSFKKLPGKTWTIQYGDGSTASGSCVSDTLVLGNLSIKNQTIECAAKLSKQFSQGTSDGLLGLAWGKINTVTDSGEADPQATPVENMIKQDDIPKEAELFTSAFYSTRDKDADSFYTFGFIDQDLVKKSGQEISWTKIDNSQGFWSFPSESVSIKGESIDLSGNTAIADTGTTLALMSDEVVEKLYHHIPGATYDILNQGYIFPVGVKPEDIPEIKVAVGDKQYVIQKEDIAFALTDDKKSWFGGIQSRGEMPFDILGDTFLKSVYAVWDQGHKRLGLVPKIQDTQNFDPPPDDSGSDGGEKAIITSVQLLADDIV
ncbi:hypothetical protein M426DRAFT_54390 [Hypoxylon sp. CI-4A]|nr:hypothetical protein M426DRAFT_54390 [Hypoxylon sp. CI-4A]